MNKTLLLLSAAAAFSLASCSENKTGEATSTDTTTTTSTTTTPSMATAYSEEAIQRRADRIAADMAAKMKFDDATRTKIRTVYLTRGQRIAELQSKYATDTMGMSAAMRDVYSNSDMEMKSILTDPTQYSAYESSRVEYMDDRYMDDDASMVNSSDANSSDMNSSGSTSMESGSGSMGGEGKLKVKRDGDIKIKDSEGNKAKIDADDATMKAKPVDGEKVKVE